MRPAAGLFWAIIGPAPPPRRMARATRTDTLFICGDCTTRPRGWQGAAPRGPAPPRSGRRRDAGPDPVPGRRREEALVHVPDHAQELLPGGRERDPVRLDVGAGRRVEHADDAARRLRGLLDIRMKNDRAAPRR